MRAVEPYKRANGQVTYKVRFRMGRRQTSQTFDTESEAKRFAGLLDLLDPQSALDQLEVDARGGNAPPLNEVAADHIAHLTRIEEGTRLNYTRLWGRTWGPRIGDLPANLVTRDRIAEAVIDLAKHYSAKSLKNQRGLLASVCDRCVDKGYLAKNPTVKLDLPRSKEGERVEMRLLTEEELQRILAAAHPHYRPLIRFLADTGTRWGEAAALRCSEVALDRRPNPQVHIRQALKWSPDNDRTIGPTKTKKSNRWVPLTGQLVLDLKGCMAGKGRNDLVFTAPRGGPVQHRTFWSDIWLPALTKAGIEPPRPRVHDLRHSFASRALGAGVPTIVVSRLLGHEHISTTSDTYGHLEPDALSQAIQAIESVSLPPLAEVVAITSV